MKKRLLAQIDEVVIFYCWDLFTSLILFYFIFGNKWNWTKNERRPPEVNSEWVEIKFSHGQSLPFEMRRFLWKQTRWHRCHFLSLKLHIFVSICKITLKRKKKRKIIFHTLNWAVFWSAGEKKNNPKKTKPSGFFVPSLGFLTLHSWRNTWFFDSFQNVKIKSGAAEQKFK